MSLDMNQDSRSIRNHHRPEDLAATLVAPIKRGQRILGALHIFREKDYEFDEESISVATSFADQAAVAIDNARLHEAANKSLEFFRSVVDDNADAIILQDAERRIIHWNQGAEELYGYTEEEALGENIDVIFTDDDLERQARGNPVFESGLTCHFEGIRVRKDGSHVPVGITLSPIKSEDGDVIALSAIHKNLSERNRAEEELRQSEEKYRTLIEFAADAIFVHGLDAKFIDVNHRACEILGYTREELLTMSVSDISVTFQHSKFLEQTNQMKEGEQSTFEGIHRRKDGSTFPVEICAGKVYSNGQPLTISLVRDITERRRSEEELKMARDEAEAASHAKSEFLSTMSHELRSPLNAVIGFSDLLLRETDENDDLTHRLVPKIRDSGKYLLKMIEELLDFDRIEAGKVSLKLEAASINDIVFRVVDSWRLRFPEGYSLTLQLDHACGVIGCDTTRISQILNNLIDNAVKYSPDGGTIRVCTIATPEEFQVSVQDEGMGITSEEKEIIFDRFRQLESGYTRRAGGLGIGLALAQELMQMHGGRIWVESDGEKGSTFSLALPRLQVTPRPEGLHSERAEEIGPNENPWDGRKILVVDDVEHYHEYMKILMRDAGHLVSAHNGEEALEAANRELPDIILMDLRMPVMDGFESIQRLKADPETKGIPILAVTAQAMNQDKEDSIEAGADGFVTKPIQIESLKEEMWRVLGAKV